MPVRRSILGIDGPQPLARSLRDAQYIADEGLATAAYLALALGKPLLLEGSPGVGKTEAAKAIASVLGRELVRRAIAHTAQVHPGHGIRISAQSRLERFYGELGFVAVGAPYMEDGIPHTEMLLPG